jgi:RecA-family ATPase
MNEEIQSEVANSGQGRQQDDRTLLWTNLLTRDQKDLPKRSWVIPGFLMRRVVTIIAGHGGAGKSILTLTIALMAALGQKFASYGPPAEPLNVLIVNAEDSIDEMDLRLEAALTAFEGPPAELRKLAGPRLHTVKRANYYLVAREGERIIETKFCQTLSRYIEAHEIGLLIFDPAISAHSGLDENHSEMQTLIDKFRCIAVDCDIPVALVHHYRKSGIAGDANSARGSSTMIDASRNVITVDSMSEKEASAMLSDPEERTRYFSVSHGKSNYALKSPRQWFRIDSVTLANGETAPRIAVAEFEGNGGSLDPDDLASFLDEIDAGLPNGDRYTTSGKDDHRLDALLMRNYAVPKARAKKIIENLVKTNIIALSEYKKANRHKGMGYVVNERPSGDY